MNEITIILLLSLILTISISSRMLRPKQETKLKDFKINIKKNKIDKFYLLLDNLEKEKTYTSKKLFWKFVYKSVEKQLPPGNYTLDMKNIIRPRIIVKPRNLTKDY